MYINNKLEEFNNFIHNKKVAIIGLGVSNIPLLDYLNSNKAEISVFDKKNISQLDDEVMQKITEYSVQWYSGDDYLKNLTGFDLIFRSPSCMPDVPELLKEEQKGAIITTEIEMLIKLAPCKVIGVTGSDGKTTTTSLIYEILKYGGYNVHLGGNIGIPLFTKLNEILPEDIIVLELSSFQLMNMDVSPNISVITNVTPNHLDIHKSYEEYIEAKKNIFKYQSTEDIIVLNYDNEITRNCKDEAVGKVKYFSHLEKINDGVILHDNIIKVCKNKIRTSIINTKDVLLRGQHNYENICTAICATEELVNIETIKEAVINFKGVEHRLEYIKTINGVNWYNDSIGSSPTRTIAGLYAFDERIILIAGGYDKNLDYQPLAKPILEKVDTLILVGQTSSKIASAVNIELLNKHKNIDMHFCKTLEETVKLAHKIAKSGDIVLFSPASASFDMFKNFDERGKVFKKLVNQI